MRKKNGAVTRDKLRREQQGPVWFELQDNGKWKPLNTRWGQSVQVGSDEEEESDSEDPVES